MTIRGRDVLDVLFDGSDGVIEFRALPSRARGFFAPTDAAVIGAWLADRRSEDCYFGVATRRDDTGGALAHCHALPALFADLDCHDGARTIDDARQALAALPLPPSIVIGSGGGLHAYWLLREPIAIQDDPAQVTILLRRLAAAVGGDLAAAEPARILRVPGTRNYKYTPPRAVTINVFDPDRRINPSDLDEYLPAGEAPVVTLPASGGLAEPIPVGHRNDVLYRLARSLRVKQFPAAFILETIATVNARRCVPPLPDHDVHALVEHALVQPDRQSYQAAVRRDAPPTAETAVIRSLADVPREYVDWLWRGRLARGALTLWIGDGGLGKSRTSNDVASRLTTGAAWPDGGVAPIGRVVILSAEDSPAYTIRPAMEAAGADLSRVLLLEAVRDTDGTERPFQLATDLAALAAVLAQHDDVALVVIDPLSAYFGTRLDSYRDSDVRSVLAPLVTLAETHRVAVLGIMHVGKAADRQARHRVLGSVAFVNAARLVFAIGPDPTDDNRRILVPVKSNLCRDAEALAFRLEDADGVARAVWDPTPVPGVNADTVLAGKPQSDREDQTDAEHVIRTLLETEDWPLDAKIALDAGKAHGIPDRTLRWTAKRLGIDIKRLGFGRAGRWLWYPPADIPATHSGNTPPECVPIAPIAPMPDLSDKAAISLHRGNNNTLPARAREDIDAAFAAAGLPLERLTPISPFLLERAAKGGTS